MYLPASALLFILSGKCLSFQHCLCNAYDNDENRLAYYYMYCAIHNAYIQNADFEAFIKIILSLSTFLLLQKLYELQVNKIKFWRKLL